MWFALTLALLASAPDGGAVVAVRPDAGALAPVKRVRRNLAIFPAEGKGAWTPASDDVLAIEERLPSFLRSNEDPLARGLAKKLGNYKRQYRGVLRDGRRFVELNALCEDFLEGQQAESDAWLREWIVVMDGGDCFFQLTYDVEEEELGELMINGEG